MSLKETIFSMMYEALENMEEAVEVRHDRYMRSHGKKARDSGQGSSTWMFTHKDRGDVDYNNKKEVHTAQGKFSDAKKSAQAWAKENGHHSVYVMEAIEEIDELNKSTLGSYVKRSADDLTHIQRDITSGGTQAPEYKGLSRMRRNRKAGIANAVNRLTKEEAEIKEL